jgi:LacI family transcriptional regulator
MRLAIDGIARHNGRPAIDGRLRGSNELQPGRWAEPYLLRRPNGQCCELVPRARRPSPTDRAAGEHRRGWIGPFMTTKPILRDVAQAAGVSLRTASRVLNGDPAVAVGTRARVRQVMEELHYQPDFIARSLRAGADSTIGVIIESIADPFFSAMTEAVESSLSRDGRSVLVASTHRDGDTERRAVDNMLQRRVGGLVIAPTDEEHSWLSDIAAPVVLVDREATGVQADVVVIDDEQAAFDAVAHLIAHGHRRIGYVGDSPEVRTSAARLQGYINALTSHRLARSGDLIRSSCDTSLSAGQATVSLLHLDEPPTAIFSANTRCSLGVVPALHTHGRTDIALVGLGDFAMADALNPAVTVIDHSPVAIGKVAAHRLLTRIANPGLAARRTVVPVRLVERGSGELRPRHDPDAFTLELL